MLLLLLSHFSRVRLCVTPQTAAHQAPPSLGFSRQEHWSGLPFPSPMHESEKWKWSRSVVSDSWRPHGPQPTRLLHPWIFQARVLEQSASAFSKKHATVSQIRNKELFTHCAVLSRSVMSNSFYPMDCNPPGSSVPGDSPGKNTGVGCHALLQGIFRTQLSHIAGRFFTVWATREAHSLETLKNNSLSEVHFPPK